MATFALQLHAALDARAPLDLDAFRAALRAAGLAPPQAAELAALAAALNRPTLRGHDATRRRAAALFLDAVPQLARAHVQAHLRRAGAHYRVCDFCTAHRNVLTGPDGLVAVLCESCVAGLGQRLRCPRCARPRYVNGLGEPAQLCKWCHKSKTRRFKRPRGRLV